MGTLKGLVIAVTGTLEHEYSQLKKWIEANGGRYTPSVCKGTTHLITGKDAWKKASDAVQAAITLGAFVVDYEWLEDSLQKGRKLAETKYTWEYLWQQKKREKKMKSLGLLADAKRFNDGCDQAAKATGTGTSKSRPRVVARKPKQSKSFFFGDVVNVPFVSAADELNRRREEREAAKAKKAEEQAAKKTEQVDADLTTSSVPSVSRSITSNANTASSPTSASSHTLSTTISQSCSSGSEVQAKKPSLKDLYHFYLDTTGFEYKILLTRCNLRANEITRYRLSILESHTKPHVYCTFIEFLPPGGTATTTSGEACIQALLDFSNTFPDDDATPEAGPPTPSSNNEDHKTTSQENAHTHPEATRLRAILSPPPPSPTLPYKTLLDPLSSPFQTAWRTFRHTFRDLTLLSWEERFDISKALYKTRAQHLSIEPFVYVRPKPGLPLGLRVQQAGLFQNPPLLVRDGSGAVVAPRGATVPGMDKEDEGYVYNAFKLPGLAQELGDGVIGTAVKADREAAEKVAAEARRRAGEEEEARKRMVALARRNVGKPDACGRYKGGVLSGGVMKRRYDRPFPSERKGF